jgi:hypothetical protein
MDSADLPIADQLCVVPSSEMAFMEATRPVTPNNKESLSNLLDFASDKGCATVLACVDKSNPIVKNLVASYLTVGFSMVNNLCSGDYIMLGMQL